MRSISAGVLYAEDQTIREHRETVETPSVYLSHSKTLPPERFNAAVQAPRARSEMRVCFSSSLSTRKDKEQVFFPAYTPEDLTTSRLLAS